MFHHIACTSLQDIVGYVIMADEDGNNVRAVIVDGSVNISTYTIVGDVTSCVPSAHKNRLLH